LHAWAFSRGHAPEPAPGLDPGGLSRGEFKNSGSDYAPKGQPIGVDTHDFEDKELGKVVPYGVYDVGANLGYVSLGIDHDTAQTIRCELDTNTYPKELGLIP
jgi:hypothetical protein